MNNDAWVMLVNELKACRDGRQGWVNVSIKRAQEIGVAHSNLRIAAETLGLIVKKHGRYGYVATR